MTTELQLKDTISYKLGSIESKLDLALAEINKSEKAREDMAERVRSLEDSRTRLHGIAALISASVAFASTYVSRIFT